MATQKKIALTLALLAVFALAISLIGNRPEKQPPARSTPSAAAAPWHGDGKASSPAEGLSAANETFGAPVAAGFSDDAPMASVAPTQSGPVESPGAGMGFQSILDGLGPKVEAALAVGDYATADRHIDAALATPGLSAEQMQRLTARKIASRGMRGDHAGMLVLMDKIIAVDPRSSFAATMLKERAHMEKLAQAGRNPPHFCETCREIHEAGRHPPPK